MNDQAKKLRELAQKIKEERGQTDLFLDPAIKNIARDPISWDVIPSFEKLEIGPSPEANTGTQINTALLDEPESVEPGSKASVADQTSQAMKTFSTRVVAVSSGKGGVGKSNLVVNLGIALAMQGKRVMILDADLGLANIDVLLGLNPKYNLKHLVDGERAMEEILVDGPYAVKIVPGGSGIPELANMGDEQQQKLLESFIELERESDITLIDTGAGISKDVISFIVAAREALIITTPEPTAITDAYGVIKVVTQKDPDVDIKLVVNMVSNEKEGKEIANRIAMATKQFLNRRIESLGYIVSDPAVNLSVRKQEPFILEYPNSKVSNCIKQIAMRLDNIGTDEVRVAGRNGFRGFLSRLFER